MQRTARLILCLLCGLAGLAGLNAASRYALGLPGALLTGWALLRAAGPAAQRQWPLRLAGVSFFIYGLDQFQGIY